VGVTDTTITLGGVFQMSGPVTGFGQEFLNGVTARLAKANAEGGVCGRQLDYLSRDDGMDAARNASETEDLMSQVLALVGSFSTVDAGGANVLDGTNVPDIGAAASPRRDRLANHRSHIYFPETTAATAEWKYTVSQGAKTAVLVYVSLSNARELADNTAARMTDAGLQVVDRIELAPTQFSYDGVARDIANSGADVMWFLHEVNASVAMAQALSDVDHGLEYPVFSAFSYSPKFLELAGASADGLALILPFQPFEETAANPALAEFTSWLQQAAPGSGPTYDSLEGWAVTELFLQGLTQIPGPITRDALLASVSTFSDFDAGGAWSPTHPNDRLAPWCQVLLRAKGGAWTREAPATGFMC
jgi:ABC-type branched-subunit amino acid transport system substrate-binding protein